MITMPAGKYYVGDLCYVMVDAWDEVCELLFETHEYGKFVLKDGREFAIFPTKFGDGSYNGISVDSGTIGCIKYDSIFPEMREYDSRRFISKTIEFDSDFEVFEDNGYINIGHLEIDTNDDYEDDYYSDDDDDEDD